MRKTEVYSWRVSPELKSELEGAARGMGTSVGGLLEIITRAWLKARDDEGEAEQQRLHEAARSWIGSVVTGRSDLSERASEEVGEMIRQKHARDRAD